MTYATGRVHEVRLEFICDPLKYYARRVGRRHRDVDYTIKGAIAGVFDDRGVPENAIRLRAKELGGDSPAFMEYRKRNNTPCLRPFFKGPIRGRTIPVWGYSTLSADELRWRSEQFADSEAFSVMDPRSLCSKPLPRYWSKRVGFSVTAVPVKEGQLSYYDMRKKKDPSISRQEAYVEWLTGQIEKPEGWPQGTGVKLVEASLTTTPQSKKVWRAEKNDEDGRREEYQVYLTVVELIGTLEVESSYLFNEFLLVGIGRERGFGYGMLRTHQAASSLLTP